MTEEKRKLVIQLLAFGRNQEEIAAALGITGPTLRKNYFRELKAKDEARARVEARLLTALMEQVDSGNVSAIDKYFKRLERADQRALAEMVANRGSSSEGKSVSAAKSAPLGKKEEAKRAAGEYSGIFAPPDAPTMQ